MASINKVILIGRLGKDPEVRFMQNGEAVANISLATEDSWTDKATKDKKKATEWHRVTFYSRLAEIVEKYLVKGSFIYVEGKLKTRKWQDKDGKDVYTTEVIAQELRMLGSAEKPTDAEEEEQPKQPVLKQSPKLLTPTTRGSSGFDDMDDDIPF